MATYPPPTEQLPIFDSTVFSSPTDDALTYDSAKRYFLTFPNAQGTETLQTTNVDGLLTCNANAKIAGTPLTNYLEFPDATRQYSAAASPSTLLASNNTWVGTNAFNNVAPPTSTSLQPAYNDTTTKMPTTAWVQTAITNGTAASTYNLNGGLGGYLPYQSATSTTSFLANGTAGQILQSNGTTLAPSWVAPPVIPATPTLSQVLVAGNSAGVNSINMNSQTITGAASVTATTFNGALNGNANTASVLQGGTAWSLPYQTNALTTNYLPNSGTGYLLSANVANPPSWKDPTTITVGTATNALACSGNSATSTATTLVNVSATIPTGVYNIPVCSSTGANQQLRSDNILQYDTSVSPAVIISNLNGQADTALISTNIKGGGAGRVPYNTGTSATTFTAVGTAGQVLQSNGTSAPTWTTNIGGNATTATTATNALACSGNSATATNATKITLSNTASGTTNYVVLSTTNSGSSSLITDTSGLSYDSTTNTLVANITGNSATATNATNQANGVVIPAMYFFYADATGGGSTEGGTITFSTYGITMPDTNYAVFSSIYYGYSGSGGTYNASGSSSAINTMVITDITTTSFSWIFSRGTGNNLNVKVIFQLCRSPSLNYAKAY